MPFIELTASRLRCSKATGLTLRVHPRSNTANRFTLHASYEEKLVNTTWKAEELTHVLSLQEEEKQKALRLEFARSVGIHLDSSLSIQTQRRYMSKMLANIEELRTKYKVMANIGSSASTTSFTSVKMQSACAWRKGSPSMTPSGTLWQTRTTECSIGS